MKGIGPVCVTKYWPHPSNRNSPLTRFNKDIVRKGVSNPDSPNLEKGIFDKNKT